MSKSFWSGASLGPLSLAHATISFDSAKVTYWSRLSYLGSRCLRSAPCSVQHRIWVLNEDEVRIQRRRRVYNPITLKGLINSFGGSPELHDLGCFLNALLKKRRDRPNATNAAQRRWWNSLAVSLVWIAPPDWAADINASTGRRSELREPTTRSTLIACSLWQRKLANVSSLGSRLESDCHSTPSKSTLSQ